MLSAMDSFEAVKLAPSFLQALLMRSASLRQPVLAEEEETNQRPAEV